MGQMAGKKNRVARPCSLGGREEGSGEMGFMPTSLRAGLVKKLDLYQMPKDGRGRLLGSTQNLNSLISVFQVDGDKPSMFAMATRLSITTVHAVHLTFHGPSCFVVKNLFLFSTQAGIKNFGGFSPFLHLCVMPSFHRLHLVQTFGRGHFFECRTIGPRHVLGVLHGLCELSPRSLLRRLQVELGFKSRQMLVVALGFLRMHFFHAASMRAVGGCVLGQCCAGQASDQSGGDQGAANRFHGKHPLVDGMPPV